jgi:hypothetical protein
MSRDVIMSRDTIMNRDAIMSREDANKISNASNSNNSSNSRNASNSRKAGNSTDTVIARTPVKGGTARVRATLWKVRYTNNRVCHKSIDANNDQKPATASHWSSATATAVMAVRAGKLASRWMPATTGTTATAEKP